MVGELSGKVRAGRRRGVALVGTLVLAMLAGCDDSAGRKTSTSTSRSTSTSITVTTLAPGFPTPEDAIRAYVEAQGNEYVGACADADLEADVGKWCSALDEDRGATRTYGIGPTFAEFVELLTLTEATGWTVTGSEGIPPIG